MRRITRSGSQYSRYSAFNPDKTDKVARCGLYAVPFGAT